MLIHHSAAAVPDLLHHMGLVQVAAVDAGGLCGDEGDGGHVEVLAEGVAGQIQLGKVALGHEDAGGLTGQIDAGAFQQAEGAHILVEGICSQSQATVDEGGVTGVTGGLLQGLMPVAAGVAAVDGLAHDGDGAGAFKGGAHIHHALLQRCRQRQDLEGGAGLIGVVEGLVAPLAQLLIRQ